MALKRHRHYGNHLVLAYLLSVAIAAPFVGTSVAAVALLGVAVVVAAPVGYGAVFRHRRGLCDECIASMPLNVQEETEKRKPILRAMHVMYLNGWWSAALAVGSLALTVTAMVMILTKTPGSTWVWEASLVLPLAERAITMTHTKYQPWCPYCRRGPGGGGAWASKPDPSIPQPI